MFDETGRVVGFKAAGGIRTAKQAIHQLVLVNETLGPDWLTPERFRIGASSLLNDVLMQIRPAHRALLEPGLLHGRLRPRARKRPGRAPVHRGFDVRLVARVAGDRQLEERYGLFIGGGFVEPRSGEYLATTRPVDRGAAGGGLAGRAGGRRSRSRPPAGGVRKALVSNPTRRARQVPLPHRADPPGARARVRRARVAERRQADQGVARRGRARWPQRTSSTTPAGRTSSSTPFRTPGRSPSASPRR